MHVNARSWTAGEDFDDHEDVQADKHKTTAMWSEYELSNILCKRGMVAGDRSLMTRIECWSPVPNTMPRIGFQAFQGLPDE